MQSANQTLKTLLILDSAQQQTAISWFHVPRPTLVIVRLQSLGSVMEQTTSNSPVISHSAEFQEPTES